MGSFIAYNRLSNFSQLDNYTQFHGNHIDDNKIPLIKKKAIKEKITQALEGYKSFLQKWGYFKQEWDYFIQEGDD